MLDNLANLLTKHIPFDDQQQFESFLEQYASFIRAQAIEQAAIKVDNWNIHFDDGLRQLAAAIRTLK